jgi:hypothetical protein
MNKLWNKSPVLSFVCCFLSGAILLVNGIARKDYFPCGLGLFFVGVAFFVGPILGLAIKKHEAKPDDK